MTTLRRFLIRMMISLLMLCAGVRTANAQEMTASLMSDGRFCKDCAWLQLSGQIQRGDADKLLEALNRYPFVTTIQIDSPGGAVLEALRMGRIARARSATLIVGSSKVTEVTGRGQIARKVPGFCYSACIYVLAGGVERLRVPESSLGVHQFSGNSDTTFAEAISVSQELSAELISYLQDMQVDPAVLIVSASAKPQELELLDDTEALRLRLLTGLQSSFSAASNSNRLIGFDPFGDSSRLPPRGHDDCLQPPFTVSNSAGNVEMAQRRNRTYRELCTTFFQITDPARFSGKPSRKSYSECSDVARPPGVSDDVYRHARSRGLLETRESCEAEVRVYLELQKCAPEIWAHAADELEEMYGREDYVPPGQILAIRSAQMANESASCR
jgi:hypothetical protein